MITEGKLSIDLGPKVRIRSNRTASVARLLVGRSPQDALALLPVLFSLCAHAHVAAARLVMGQGSDNDKDAMLVLAENAREHLLRIMLGWKTGAQVSMPSPPVMALVPDMVQAVDESGCEQVADRLEAYLETHVFGIAPADFLAGGFSGWLAQARTPAAGYLREILSRGWAGLGAVSPAFLPELASEELATRMQDEAFCLAPDWLGAPCETGPLARQCDHPVMAGVIREHGAGLLARLVARLVELARIPAQMRDGDNPVCGQAGAGIVETARGRLIHRARVVDGAITQYRILAPTEWNFHPQGVAVQALSGLEPDQAKAVVEAIDPCVDFELRAA